MTTVMDKGITTASKILSSLGYAVIDTELETEHGIIDIVAMRNGTVHYIMVMSDFKAINPTSGFRKTMLKRFVASIGKYAEQTYTNAQVYSIDVALVDMKNRVFNLVENADSYFK